MCLVFFSCLARAEVVEEIITLPVSVKNIYGGEFKHDFIVTVFRDKTRSKSPWLILNHGRPVSGALQLGRQRYSKNSRYFVEKGFIVFVPTRVGYGPTGGPDVEDAGSCHNRNYPAVYQAALEQVLQSLIMPKNFLMLNPARVWWSDNLLVVPLPSQLQP